MAVRAFSKSGLQFFASSSFSKNFSLYGERVGALSIVTAGKDESARVMSQVKRVIRTNYSNPPSHGAQLVALTLAGPLLVTTRSATGMGGQRAVQIAPAQMELGQPLHAFDYRLIARGPEPVPTIVVRRAVDGMIELAVQHAAAGATGVDPDTNKQVKGRSK